MEAVPDWLSTIIEEYSNNSYHVEFKKFIYNHMYQGIVALYRVGADEKRLRQFTETYVKDLEPIRLDPGQAIPTSALLSPSELQEILGERQKFPHLVAHFRQRLNDLGDDLDLLISEELPVLCPAISAKVLHGIIQIGYGYSLGHVREVCEGLAYMHYSYSPHPVSSRHLLTDHLGTGGVDFWYALRSISKDKHLMGYMDDGPYVFGDDRDENPFLVRLATLLERRGDELVNVVNTIKMPSWFDKDNLDKDHLRRLGVWMLDCAILLYGTCQQTNDHYLLHGITGGWGLAQVLHTIRNKHHALEAVTYFLSSVVAHYVVEGAPPLEMSYLYRQEAQSWDTIIAKGLEGERDEHVYKVLHILRARYQQCGDHENYDKEMKDRCINAAQIVVNFPMSKAKKIPFNVKQ